MSFAAVIVGGIGAGVSLWQGAQQADAQKKAAQQQIDANNQAIALQQEAAARAKELMTPYADTGRAASDMSNALLGIDDPNGYGVGAFTPPELSTPEFDGSAQSWIKYYGLESEFARHAGKRFGTPDSFMAEVLANWNQNGQYKAPDQLKQEADAARAKEQATPEYQAKLTAAKAAHEKQTSTAKTAAKTKAEKALADSPWMTLATKYGEDRNAQADKFENDIWLPTGKGTYDESPWKAMSGRATDDAIASLRNDFAGDGALLSGRMLKTGAETRAKIDDSFFGDYLSNFESNVAAVHDAEKSASNDTFNASTGAVNTFVNQLNGKSSTGFAADTNIANAGTAAANNASNLTANNGVAAANGTLGAASATSDAIGDTAGWLGWVYGQKKPTTNAASRTVDPSSIRVTS